MASYRFCRSDDLPLLARAHAACVPAELRDPAWDDAGEIKRAARAIDLWTSGAMLAVEGDAPIAILLAGKRASEAAILALGVREDRRRQGHGRHLVESLCSKLSILGPPRLLVELPGRLKAAAAFFEACGFAAEAEFRDFVAPPQEAGSVDLVVPVTLAELVAAGAIDPCGRRSWARAPSLLERRAERLRGLAVAAGDGIEAALVCEAAPTERVWRVLALHCTAGERQGLWLRLLLQALAAEAAWSVELARFSEEEVPFATLAACGFVERDRTLVYSRSATR